MISLINLDKDPWAISLASGINAADKKGYIMKDGYCFPAGKSAEHKFWQEYSIRFQKKTRWIICRKYLKSADINLIMKNIFDIDKHLIERNIDTRGKVTVGLNTGCGERWTSRLWKNDYWIDLIRKLKTKKLKLYFLADRVKMKK